MNYAFLCEFEELHSAKRATRDQVRLSSLALTLIVPTQVHTCVVLLQGGGVHGNAILTWQDLLHCRALEHRCATSWPGHNITPSHFAWTSCSLPI